MRAKFLQHIIDETPFCVDYKVMKWAEKLKQNNMEKLEFKGTKGEWVVDHGESAYNEHHQLCTPISRIDGLYPTIIGLCDVYGEDEQAQANAKLIASAPLLLKEHETDLDVLNKWVEKFNGVFGVGSDMSQELEDMIKSKKVAIFKALK